MNRITIRTEEPTPIRPVQRHDQPPPPPPTISPAPPSSRVPGRPRGKRTEDSISDRVAKLKVGQCVPLAHRYPRGLAPADTDKVSQSLDSTLRSAALRARKGVDGFRFKIERGQFVTQNDGALVLVCLVTRTA